MVVSPGQQRGHEYLCPHTRTSDSGPVHDTNLSSGEHSDLKPLSPLGRVLLTGSRPLETWPGLNSAHGFKNNAGHDSWRCLLSGGGRYWYWCCYCWRRLYSDRRAHPVVHLSKTDMSKLWLGDHKWYEDQKFQSDPWPPPWNIHFHFFLMLCQDFNVILIYGLKSYLHILQLFVWLTFSFY